MKRFRVTGEYEADGKPVSVAITAEDMPRARARAKVKGIRVSEIQIEGEVPPSGTLAEPAMTKTVCESDKSQEYRPLDLCVTKRNALALWTGGLIIIGVIGPTTPGEDISGAVFTLAILGSAGMLVAGIHLLLKAIAKLEKENVELRSRLSALERAD